MNANKLCKHHDQYTHSIHIVYNNLTLLPHYAHNTVTSQKSAQHYQCKHTNFHIKITNNYKGKKNIFTHDRVH